MNNIIVINAEHGGSDNDKSGKEIREKDYALKISNCIDENLKKENVKTYMVRTSDEDISIDERVNLIDEETPNTKETIVITNSIGKTYGGVEIIYSLDDSSKLASLIANELSNIGLKVNKYYQRRLPSNPALDYHEILRDVGNRESIIIEYGDLAYDEESIINNYERMAQAVTNAINKYLGLIDTYYTVKKGDNLFSIANAFNTTVEQIKTANNLSNNFLSIGQELLIPKSSNDNIYIVKKGDNLYQIAKKYNTTVSNLMKINNLDTTLLSIGQNIKIS